MSFNYYFNQVPSPTAIREYAGRRFEQEVKTTNLEPKSAHATFSLDGALQKVRVGVTTVDGYRIRVEEAAASMYEAIDCAARKLGRQLYQHQELDMIGSEQEMLHFTHEPIENFDELPSPGLHWHDQRVSTPIPERWQLPLRRELYMAYTD